MAIHIVTHAASTQLDECVAKLVEIDEWRLEELVDVNGFSARYDLILSHIDMLPYVIHSPLI